MKNSIKYYSNIAVIIALFGCTSNTIENTKGNNEIAIQLEEVEMKRMVQPVYASGLLFSEKEAVLSFKIGGVIQQIFVNEGDAVKKDQLLAKLDQTEIEAQVIQAQNGVEKAQRDLERVRNLYADDAATLENVQDLTTAYNVAKESLRIARFNQKFAEIRAISDGRIVRKMKNKGELVSSGMPIFFMNDTSNDQWKLEAGIADKDWARISSGDSAILSFDAFPEQRFEGKVIRLAEGADPANGSYQVEIQVYPKERKFAAGLFAKVKITPSNERLYHVIPIEAIVDGFGKSAFVFITNKNQTVRKVPIEIAFIQDNYVAVRSGLENIETVITSGSGYLTEFSSVKVLERPAAYSSLINKK